MQLLQNGILLSEKEFKYFGRICFRNSAGRAWSALWNNGIQPEHMSTVVAGSNPAESNYKKLNKGD